MSIFSQHFHQQCSQCHGIPGQWCIGVNASEGEQLLDRVGGSIYPLGNARQHGNGGSFAQLALAKLYLGLDRRQWRHQLVGGIGGKSLLRFEGKGEALQQLVEGSDHRLHFLGNAVGAHRVQLL